MNDIAIEILIIAILLVLNALFSMSEMAIVSARKPRLQQLASKGNKGATQALKLIESPNRFLSTIQIGITLVGVLSGAFGGATISENIRDYLLKEYGELLSPEVAEGIGVSIVVSVITFLSVVLGELVPKRLALKYPEKIATATAGSMSKLSAFSLPVVWLFSTSTEFILKILGLDTETKEANVTHEEIKAIVELGAKEGVIEKKERMMMDRALNFGKKRVITAMTLARDITWLDTTKPFEQERAKVLKSPYSVYPVAEGNLDTIIGVILAKDMARLILESESNLSTYLFQPLFVPETSTILQVLELFQKTGLHICMVIDEFGVIQGLLTMSNVMEALVGDLPTAGIAETSSIVQREDSSWLVDGLLSIDELKESLRVEYLEGEDEKLFHTVGGFVMHRLGRVPKETDNFIWDTLRFEVVSMDKNRISKVVISQTQKSSEIKAATQG